MVREMMPEDMDRVFEIEQTCFSHPWSLRSVKSGQNSSIDTWLVLEEEGDIRGYCVFRVIGGEGELLRIAILPEFRGRGLSKKLMDQMVEYSRKKNVHTIYLEVRESNIKARNLYKSYGFSEESIRKNYYRHPCENAVIMRTRRI